MLPFTKKLVRLFCSLLNMNNILSCVYSRLHWGNIEKKCHEGGKVHQDKDIKRGEWKGLAIIYVRVVYRMGDGD